MDANLADKRALDLRTTFIATDLASAGDYLAPMQPRVLALAVFTALVGSSFALGQVQPAIGAAALLCSSRGRRRRRPEHVVKLDVRRIATMCKRLGTWIKPHYHGRM